MSNIKMKRIINMCIFFIVFLSIYNLFKAPKYTSIFQNQMAPMNGINKSLIKSISENEYDSNTIEYSKREIITMVLDIIDYDKWMDFIDYIDMNLYYGNINSNLSEELIMSLNLSKDLGVIVIFDEYENNYIFNSKIENLSPIEDIRLLEHPKKNKNFIAIYQTNDESLGSFFYENFIQIYDCTEPKFDLVWENTILYEEIYNDTWIDLEAAENNWTMVIERTDIDFDYTDSIKINTVTSLEKYKTESKTTPTKNNFTLKEEKSFIRSYYWSEEYNAFILGKLTEDVFISDIAIIEDMENKHEWLFGIKNPYYKIYTTNKELIYLPKSKFNKLIQNSFY